MFRQIKWQREILNITYKITNFHIFASKNFPDQHQCKWNVFISAKAQD